MIGKIGSVLGPPGQIERDRRAIRIFESDAVQRAMRRLEAVYEAEPIVAWPGARSTYKLAAHATAMAQAAGVVNKDADRPFAYWSITSPHSWGDVHVPLTGLMIDNPDNVYRTIPVDGAASYEIVGKVVGAGPAQETFILHEEPSGESRQEVRSNQAEAGSVSLHDLIAGGNGEFLITIDPSPAGGRLNHLQTSPQGRNGMVVIRSTLADWTRDSPSRLEVRRVGGPPLQAELSDQALAERAAAATVSVGEDLAGLDPTVFFQQADQYRDAQFCPRLGLGSCQLWSLPARR